MTPPLHFIRWLTKEEPVSIEFPYAQDKVFNDCVPVFVEFIEARDALISRRKAIDDVFAGFADSKFEHAMTRDRPSEGPWLACWCRTIAYQDQVGFGSISLCKQGQMGSGRAWQVSTAIYTDWILQETINGLYLKHGQKLIFEGANAERAAASTSTSSTAVSFSVTVSKKEKVPKPFKLTLEATMLDFNTWKRMWSNWKLNNSPMSDNTALNWVYFYLEREFSSFVEFDVLVYQEDLQAAGTADSAIPKLIYDFALKRVEEVITARNPVHKQRLEILLDSLQPKDDDLAYWMREVYRKMQAAKFDKVPLDELCVLVIKANIRDKRVRDEVREMGIDKTDTFPKLLKVAEDYNFRLKERKWKRSK